MGTPFGIVPTVQHKERKRRSHAQKEDWERRSHAFPLDLTPVYNTCTIDIIIIIIFIIIFYLFFLIIIIFSIIIIVTATKIHWKSSGNRTQAEKKKMFSVFCNCSILRTLSLVINIIIIITIITTIVFSI